MTVRIEKTSNGRSVIIRLVGRIQSRNLDELKMQIENLGGKVRLDLEEVDLVDIDAVRFLNACEAQDVKLLNCPPYIREWMFQERAKEKNTRGDDK